MRGLTNRFASAVICIVISGLLFYVSTGFHNKWMFLWLAPVLPLMYSYKFGIKFSFSVAYISFFIGALSLLKYTETILPVKIILVPIIISSLVFSLLIVLNAVLVKRINHWTAIALFPSLWTSYEFLISLFMPSGPLNSLAFSQIQFLSFSQIASVTGVWGMTFVILLFSSGLSYAIYFKQSIWYRIFAILLPIVILAMCVFYGHIKLSEQHTSSEAVTIGLASIDAPIQVSGQAGVELTKRYIKLIDNLASQGAKWVVLPERFIGTDTTNSAEVMGLLQQAATQDNTTIIAGVARFGKMDYNSAMVIMPNSQTNGVYDKQHLVPVLESRFTRGNRLFVSQQPPSWGVAICKDMDFSKPALSYGQKHVELLLVPASDFNVDGWLHAKVAVMRGIENGFAVARSAAYGLLTISDQQGRIIAMTSDVNKAETTLLGTVTLYPSKTFYSLWGDWFGWLSLLMVFLFSIVGIFYRKQAGYNAGI